MLANMECFDECKRGADKPGALEALFLVGAWGAGLLQGIAFLALLVGNAPAAIRFRRYSAGLLVLAFGAFFLAIWGRYES